MEFLSAFIGGAVALAGSSGIELLKDVLQRKHFKFSKYHEHQISSIRICFGNLILLENITDELNQDYMIESFLEETQANLKLQRELVDKADEALKKLEIEFWANSLFIAPKVRPRFISLITSYSEYLTNTDFVLRNNKISFDMQGTQNQSLPEYNKSNFEALKTELINQIDAIFQGR
jgi:hypothetical protein